MGYMESWDMGYGFQSITNQTEIHAGGVHDPEPQWAKMHVPYVVAGWDEGDLFTPECCTDVEESSLTPSPRP